MITLAILQLDWFYYVLMVGLFYLISNLLDRLGITLKREYDDCKSYYALNGVILIVCLFTFVICLANQQIGEMITPYVIVLSALALAIVTRLYKDCYQKITKNSGSYIQKILFIVIIISYLFMNKEHINKNTNEINNQVSTPSLTER